MRAFHIAVLFVPGNLIGDLEKEAENVWVGESPAQENWSLLQSDTPDFIVVLMNKYGKLF